MQRHAPSAGFIRRIIRHIPLRTRRFRLGVRPSFPYLYTNLHISPSVRSRKISPNSPPHTQICRQRRSQQVLWWSACLVLVVIPLQNLCINLMTQIAGKAVAKDGRKSPVPGGSTIPVEKVLQGASTALKDFAAANLNLRTWTTWDTNPIVRIFTRIPLLIATLRRDWAPYFKQQNLPASLAYISLFLNPVLSPGGLMTAFLASQGVGGTASALFRSACAVTGFVGTQVSLNVFYRFFPERPFFCLLSYLISLLV